jgi:hypothetical protein
VFRQLEPPANPARQASRIGFSGHFAKRSFAREKIETASIRLADASLNPTPSPRIGPMFRRGPERLCFSAQDIAGKNTSPKSSQVIH